MQNHAPRVGEWVKLEWPGHRLRCRDHPATVSTSQVASEIRDEMSEAEYACRDLRLFLDQVRELQERR